MTRRDFVLNAAGLAAAAALPGSSRGWASARVRQAKLDRIAIMAYSFDPLVPRDPPPTDPARTLDVMDMPQMLVDRYGVRNIEMQMSYFLSTEPAYLRDFRDRVERAGSRLSQLNLEFLTNLSVPELRRRLEALELTRRWIDHAVELRCPRVMVNQGDLAPELMGPAADILRAMISYGESRNVWVTLENRGANWQALEQLVRAANGYTTPDLGNFVDQDNQLRGIRALMPFNRGNAHVKLNPARYDLPTALRLARELGYTGLYAIEAGSNVDPDPYVATQKILDVLLEHI